MIDRFMNLQPPEVAACHLQESNSERRRGFQNEDVRHHPALFSPGFLPLPRLEIRGGGGGGLLRVRLMPLRHY
jgi:hypothetical protein